MPETDFYKTFYKMWVDTTAKMIEGTMRHPLFTQGMGQALEGSVEMKKALDSLVENSLHQMQWPTPKDYASLAKKVHELEERVNALERGNHKKAKVLRG
ncbi:MAG: hypothetical protein HYT79_11115 [Elusimicrobia bacterium]|nr:hypothetical protein [Elusimicrobiota bacterium]